MREILVLFQIAATVAAGIIAIAFAVGLLAGIWITSWAMLRLPRRRLTAMDRALNLEADKGSALLAFERSTGRRG